MSKYVAKGAMRSVKNQLKGYSEIQTKVRNATSNDPWGPSGTVMAEIAQATNDPNAFVEVMAIVDKRLNDHGKNWRHVFKSLTLLDYLIHHGNRQVVQYAKENIYIVKTLREFQHIDDQGRDQGANVRQKAKLMTALLNDDERLDEERQQSANTQHRVNGYLEDASAGALVPYANGSGGDARPGERAHSSQGFRHEDEDEIRRAIEASKHTAAEELRMRRKSEEHLQAALLQSEREEREKQEMIAAQNELILTDDSRPSNWQAGGMSSSALALFGGAMEEQPLSVSNPYGTESRYTYTNNTSTVGQNNPFGQVAHTTVQQQHQLQGPPLSIEATRQLQALQMPGYGLDMNGNSLDYYGAGGNGYPQSEYGGSTISSAMDSYGGMTSSAATTLSAGSGALVPFGASTSMPTSSGGSNPFFNGAGGAGNTSMMQGGGYPSNYNSATTGTVSSMNSLGGGMGTVGSMNSLGGGGMGTVSSMNSLGGASGYGYSANTGYDHSFGGASTSGTQVGTLIDVGLPGGGPSFGPQKNKNPFQQSQASSSTGGGFGHQPANSWL